jgi:diguanylate cyclase (GGDEF)-like protein
VARYGGEEFIALLVDTGLEGARMLAERMRSRVESLRVEHRASGVSSHLTVSLGVASVVPKPAVRPEDLVDLADRALYAAKEGGRNRVVTADRLPPDAPGARPAPW